MSFISVDWTGELCLLAHCLGEDDDLLKEEDGHLLHPEVGGAARVVGAEQGTPQQQLPLGNYLALKYYQNGRLKSSSGFLLNLSRLVVKRKVVIFGTSLIILLYFVTEQSNSYRNLVVPLKSITVMC